jgi:lysozyme family protein
MLRVKKFKAEENPVSYDAILDKILKEEGGYSNRSTDRGGPTNHGITQATLSAYLGRPATIEDVQNLSTDTAKLIYTQNYIVAPHLDHLYPVDQDLADQAVDICVNSGPRNAVKMLQRVVNASGTSTIDVDGALGPGTLVAVTRAHTQMGAYMNNALVDERENFYHQIVANDSTQAEYLDGWINRAEGFRIAV